VLVGSGQGFDTWTAPELTVAVEAHAPAAWVDGLTRRGHAVQPTQPFEHQFGHANLIALAPDGVRAGAADPRARIAAAQGF
jgi:gamma-glutamyltranspeptidase/glutathione hydrolase